MSDGGDGTLLVDPKVAPRWAMLAEPVRRYLSTFLADAPAAPVPRRVVPLHAAIVSARYADDLVLGGPGLRRALPDLTRTVVGIRTTHSLVVRIHCRGHQDGTFFDMLTPSHRLVKFDEVHHLGVVDGELVEDSITVDMQWILRQLVAREGPRVGVQLMR